MHTKCIALAFSGGLDTSYCLVRLREEGWAVHTVHVNTGGADPEALAAIGARANELGAVAHHEVDARREVYDRFIRHLIRGNVLRGEVYPLSVAAERTQQAISVAETARAIGAEAVAHGSTGAGNDQVRFDVAFRVLLPSLPIVTPIRDHAVTREQSAAYLRERGAFVARAQEQVSVNEGLWGATYGGGWSHDPWVGPPVAFLDPPETAPAPAEIVISWDDGLPMAVDGAVHEGPAIVAAIGELARSYGIGRGIHVGETALGIKGRIGFEAGAAVLLIAAHRELEKLVLTKWQVFWKDQLARFYGDRLHEGQAFDPALRDIEAMLASSQRRVVGDTRVRLAPGRFQVVGVRSPHTLLDPDVAVYGEENRLWSGDEARAFARIAAIPSLLASRGETLR
jgi:argininosuccinate synthase